MKYSKKKQKFLDMWNSLSEEDQMKASKIYLQKMQELCDSIPLKTEQDYKNYCAYLSGIKVN